MMTDTRESDLDFTAVTDLDLDALFDVLSDSRRRFVLACLDEYATPLALGDVADELAVRERDAAITEIAAEDVRSVYADLYHVHVPKMADFGIVEYSQERDAVTLADGHDELSAVAKLPGIE